MQWTTALAPSSAYGGPPDPSLAHSFDDQQMEDAEPLAPARQQPATDDDDDDASPQWRKDIMPSDATLHWQRPTTDDDDRLMNDVEPSDLLHRRPTTTANNSDQQMEDADPLGPAFQLLAMDNDDDDDDDKQAEDAAPPNLSLRRPTTDNDDQRMDGAEPFDTENQQPPAADDDDDDQRMNNVPPLDLMHQRPDGIGIDWKESTLFLMEFTRPYDRRPGAMRAADRSKQQKYEAMRQFLQDRLPPPWKIETLTFSVGVLGSADEQAWERALRALSIPDPHKQRKIVIAAINTALEGYSTILAARYSQVQPPSSS